MPVDFQQVRNQVRQMGSRAPQRQAELAERFQHGLTLLENSAEDLQNLRDLVSRAVVKNSGLRCAIPCHESLKFASPAPTTPPHFTVIAADGSQVNPSRFDEEAFAVVNIGAIILKQGLGDAPQEIVDTQLLTLDEVYSQQGLLSEEMIALLRDVAERRLLAELALKATNPVLTLTDGPLEIYGEPKKESAFTLRFSEYLDALKVLAKQDVIAAGFVDKPGADLVARLLELLLLKPDEMDEAGRLRPLAGVTDIALFQSFLPPGFRSAIFELQSRSASDFKDELTIHFFYLNAGRDNQPVFARVEIPAWVAENQAHINLLHSVLLQQCGQMGTQPYPYILHRAHEIAVVRMEEKEEIKMMINSELRNQGIQPGARSMKQSNKELSSRTRYEP